MIPPMASSSGSPVRSIVVEEVDDVLWVRLEGQVTEDTSLLEVLSECQGKPVIVDSSRLERINSCGVRDWVRWVKGLEDRGNQLVHVRCSPVVVAQINMISNFMGKGQVVSFLAPYLCPDCGHEHLEPMETSGMKEPYAVPDLECPSCKSTMEFDELPESYFEFSKRRQPGAVDPSILKALTRL